MTESDLEITKFSPDVKENEFELLKFFHDKFFHDLKDSAIRKENILNDMTLKDVITGQRIRISDFLLMKFFIKLNLCCKRCGH
jgi:hypothetical protein